ncbi:helicase with zinc finger domain 2-like [Onychostoma macrolepis]|uniref:helicase with zinc finger domain 2-like n=1 Tax=Onychostoma macrolepis TaxID=369639 RepID=UPI00272A55D4|nr:helicase with zinc finger domain 2-like [Onychostoma macrolepis]XP_058635423.1 helicase with zinc finger domain 2-like [Onychostoma macrolepis]
MDLAGNHYSLQTLKKRFSLCVRCNKCSKKHNEISYSLNQVIHHCSEDILLIRWKRKNSVWRPVAPRPGRPRPRKYVVCWYYTKETGCKKHGSRCTFARSSEEAALWNTMKHEQLTIPQIVNMIKQNQRTLQSKSQKKGGQFDCTLCQVHFPTDEKLMNHCFTVKHRRLIFEDTSRTWKYRDPPPTHKDLKLCGRSLICEYGDNCTKAHSQEELREWEKRIKASRKRATDAAEMGLLSYQDKLLEEYRYSNDKKMIVSDTHPEVSISCDPDINSVNVRKKGIQCTWKLTINSKEPLEVIALLRRELGAKFSLSKDPNEERTYSTSAWYKKSQTEYEIPVFFKSDHPGLYEQWLVFDFNTRPVLRQKIKVRVGEDECKGTSVMTPAPEILLEKQETARNLEPWNEESLEIIPFFEREEAEKELLNRYKLVKIDQMNSVINHENYKYNMHHFLYREEKVEGELLTRLNLRGTAKLQNCLSDDRFGLKCAYPGTLLAAVPLSHPLTPDAPQGFIVKRHAIRSLVRVVKNNDYLGPIYEAEFLKDAATETQVLLQLSKQCCTDLNLQNGQQCEMEVQFQLNRLWFCEMHKAIDDLPNLDKVLPDLKNSNFCISSQSDTGELNEKQQAAMNFVLSVTDNRSSIPPLLIYGPFGTGKTRTLAKMTQALVLQPQNKILICTHTNSSADLYVKGHFHEYAAVHREARPLRIKAKESNPRSTDTITLQYCYLSRDGSHFEFPDKAVLDSTRIIITTTAVARFFHDMKLPENYFSHILIDEASQMLECEALMALGLAGKNTRVVLAGDHMQMGPKLFSVRQDKCSEQTLLNRLFYYYQAENSVVAKQSRIIFTENYRSTKDIVDFVSTHFYVGKSDVIKARGDVPPHPDQHALQFHHVRGECCLDPTSMSWFNAEQILSVVDIVQGIMEEWPQEWDGKDPESICVLSQGRQVLEIRQRLRQLRLPRFTVENAENVQGKQFRVIVISTVHTKDSLLETDRTCLEFFNETRVLNTIMTRAQSQIFVVGDAAALSCHQFGMCWRLWRSYIEDCINKGSAHDFTLDSLKQDLLEISELCRSEVEESSDSESTTSEILDTEDTILQELLDESKDINVSLTEEGLFPVFQHEQFVNSVNNQITELDEEQFLADSSTHKRCELDIECFYRAYARPLDEPTLRINIKGRKNIGQAFPGDKVTVEILNERSDPPMGKVINVLESADAVKEFVCTIESYDNQVMTPINKCITKIYTPFSKDKPDHIAVRNPENHRIKRFIKINEEARGKYLFIVKVLKWRTFSRYPLGTVVEVFPKMTTLDNGLNILNIEYQLRRTLSSSLRSQMRDFQGLSLFDKGRRDFRMLPTFTIDPADSQDLDDAISVRDLGECYEIGVHISDVASFVAKDSELDKYARQQCTTFYPSGKEPIHMFPKELSTNFFSLIPKHDRRAISLIIQVDTKTNCIKERSFWKSVIRSKKKFSYDEAEDIIENHQHSDQLEICLVKAWTFAEVHRRLRRQEDWCYKQPDEDVTLGRRQSHLMVEELMIMFNHMVAERLLFDETTRSITPLRCQDRPKSEKLTDLFDKNASLIPLSVHFSSQVHECEHVSHELNNQGLIHRRAMPNPQAGISDSETFPILKSVLRCLKTAVEQKNIYKIIDFIATDEIHPQLLPFAMAFRRLFHKSCILRSNSTHVSRIGHYDLDLDSYTWASSPIRRYMDVILQRLLHSVNDNTNVRYTAHDIDLSCMKFSRKNDQQSAYERKSNALRFALQLLTQSERKVAYIAELNASRTNFRLSFPLNRASISENVDIMYRDLQLADQPQFDETNNCMILKWVRRIYSFSNPHILAEVKKQTPNSVMAYVSTKTWKCVAAALREENWDRLFPLIEELDVSSRIHARQFDERLRNAKSSEKSDPMHAEHYAELSMRIKPGEAVEVQLGAATARGLMMPAIQLFVVHPKFEICLEHVKDPIKCFSKYAFHSSRNSYKTYMDYQAIWKPMCEMESASNAVAENESILIEDAALKWKNSREEKLQGFFLLPLDKKYQWSIECDLKNSVLCIRTKIHQSQSSPSQCTDLMDIPSITWVAHGIITKVEETGAKEPNNLQIDFQINHMPMTNIPEAIFGESTRFTLELIPKLLPDARKENAISSLTKANQLVKTIAIGGRINSEGGPKISQEMTDRFEIDNYLPSGFSHLNNSQRKAIREALANKFTLIQGPPGTGKTVVGVHIVYWLFKNIQKLPASNSQKKRAVLYCGPSNKSVDVVAGHLLKLRNQLRPLRIYSAQMEMLEFPYPGCNLKLSRNSKRGEKPNTELSSIALHHLIRKDANPFSTQIVAFDMKIARGDELTNEEKKLYRDVLQKARKHELLRHDVILCTCTAASHPALADALDFKQIIIDECAMATEPEAFIPLVAHKPEQIVLLGDHKQLQPVVHCDVVERLGMSKSLFERYMEKALMLDTQYRMQEDICAFPSEEFYEGKLKTGTSPKPSLFLSRSRQTCIVFGHVEGKENSLVVSTERGNENSKANLEEAEQVVRIAILLTEAGIKTKDIAILTPYNAQVANINEFLFDKGLRDITVNTIMRSQGSEWKYVIMSTVRSRPESEIEKRPAKSWNMKRLGFIMDPHQVNVGITRAQEGLCIIGNENLLRCSVLWRRLLDHYKEKGCVVNPARHIQVQKPTRSLLRTARR